MRYKLIFLFFIASTFVYGQEIAKKKLLVVHSYHQGLEWTDSITGGIESVFAPLYQKYELHYHYLDTKRHFAQGYILSLKRVFNQILQHVSYDAIIVVDNNALEFVRKFFQKELRQIPVVFCGINNFRPQLIQGLSMATGVAEDTGFEEIVDLVIKLHRDVRNIIVINDKTVTGQENRKLFQPILASNSKRVSFVFYNDFILDEIPDFVTGLKNDSVILLLTLNRDRTGRFISYADGIRMVAKYSNVPIYGAWDFYMGKGLTGGVITRGEDQGAMAAKIALRLLNGEPIGSLPVVRNGVKTIMFDYSEIKKFKIKTSLLPEKSVIINRPEGFIEFYRKNFAFIIRVTAVIVLLLVMVLILYQQKRKLYQLSITDPLTGLHNRNVLQRFLEYEILKSRRYGYELSLFMMDIDHFKQINDRYGHHQGDHVLVKLAEIMKQYARETDIVTRYGGEEFIVIMPSTLMSDAYNLAERLRKAIETEEFPHGIHITASFGITSFKDGDASEMLIKRSDQAMYAAKNGGRNRVELRL